MARLDQFIHENLYLGLPKGKYNAIYIDPPWAYNDRINDHSRGAINHYPTLTIEQLRAFPMDRFTHQDTFLFMWTTKDFYCEARKLLVFWGFEFKTDFIWVKINQDGNITMGMGHYNRLAHEYLLFGIMKGSNEKPLNAVNERSVILAPRGKHSEKPSEFRALIERNAKPPYLEIFAREKVDGWTCWGNEIGKKRANGTRDPSASPRNASII